jgi:hypothetical protein
VCRLPASSAGCAGTTATSGAAESSKQPTSRASHSRTCRRSARAAAARQCWLTARTTSTKGDGSSSGVWLTISGQGTAEFAADIEAKTPFAKLGATIKAHPLVIAGWLITVLLALLPYFLATKGQPTTVNNVDVHVNVPAQQMSPQQLDKLAKEIAEQVDNYMAKQAGPTTVPTHDVGRIKGSERNQPCPCGSGIKAKRCCADPAKSGT